MWTGWITLSGLGEPMTISRARVLALIVCSCVLSIASPGLTPPSDGNSADQIASAYKSRLNHEVVTLRIPCTSDVQHFDEDGNLRSKPHAGPWTLYGRLMVESVKTNGRQLELVGKRIWVRFIGDQMQNIVPNPAIPVEIDIDLPQGPNAATKTDAAMLKVLLGTGGKMSDIVPDYWKPYFAGVEGGAPPLTAREQFKAKLKASKTDPSKISEGVSQGKLIHAVRPAYPRQAQMIGMSGSVKLHAVIGKDGRIHSLYIEKPVGAGMDDEAVKAVQKWRYKPYYIKGIPRDVETDITINFQNER